MAVGPIVVMSERGARENPLLHGAQSPKQERRELEGVENPSGRSRRNGNVGAGQVASSPSSPNRTGFDSKVAVLV